MSFLLVNGVNVDHLLKLLDRKEILALSYDNVLFSSSAPVHDQVSINLTLSLFLYACCHDLTPSAY